MKTNQMRKAKAIYSELALVRKADTTTWGGEVAYGWPSEGGAREGAFKASGGRHEELMPQVLVPGVWFRNGGRRL